MCQSGAPTNGDDERPDFRFPADEVDTMERRSQSLPKPLHTIDQVPKACGLLRNVQLVGIFPTSRCLDDPTMPPDVKELFGGTPFFNLGEYRVAHLDAMDASATLHPITMVVNAGVEGMLTGYWGGVFSRDPPHTCWAHFETTGELETTVKERCKTPAAKTCLSKAIDELHFCEDQFQSGILPGSCGTRLERLLGLAAEFILSLDWKALLPEIMVEIKDTSPRTVRRRRARQRLTPRVLADNKAFVADGDVSSPSKATPH